MSRQRRPKTEEAEETGAKNEKENGTQMMMMILVMLKRARKIDLPSRTSGRR
jgi:hypothetical protein